MVKLRRAIHKHPEGGFKEHETGKLLKKHLLDFGISKDCITDCAQTGMYVDIDGTGPIKDADAGIKVIALRADMDGLPMPENNPDLVYKSETDHAHMCGHDGHMATITSVA